MYLKRSSKIEVFDLKLNSYRLADAKLSSELKTIFEEKDVSKRLSSLFNSDDRQAKFIAACLADLWHYAAYHLTSIADSVRDVDLAIRWGFGWDAGPFELWQQAGVASMLAFIKNSAIDLPTWLNSGTEFYKDSKAYSPEKDSYVPQSKLAVYQRQYYAKDNFPKIFENSNLKLVALKDEIAMLSFKTKANTINQELLESMQEALDITESRYQGLIIYQENAENFSAGADLRMLAELISKSQFAALDAILLQFQTLVLRFKYLSIPVIAAVRGRALGGGCELVLHCAKRIAAFESYFGLVEVGVGLIPAGGGCTALALKASAEKDIFAKIKSYFQQLATGAISSSAIDASERGFLSSQDKILMNKDEVLNAAIFEISAMQAANYQLPRAKSFKIAGREGHARLKAELVNWKEGQFISEHDFLLADKIASILCGGDLYENEMVDESWLHKLEREAFLELAATAATQARIKHFLETGKPLRN